MAHRQFLVFGVFSTKMNSAIEFGTFRLDFERGALLRDGEPVALRRKTFWVLWYLAARPAQLISKDELLDAVWRSTSVSENVLSVCVSELRAALGDRGRRSSFIETAHGRGYRFVAPVSVELRRVVDLIGREPALGALERSVEACERGERQSVFVEGEAGVGKTALVQALIDGLSAGPTTARSVCGQCVEHFGGEEPYLPVLDALGRLSREEGAEFQELLTRWAPSWQQEFPRLRGNGSHPPATSRKARLSELVGLIDELARERPLIVWLEDLHWCDPSTAELISTLIRRSARARLVVVGTLRTLPADHHLVSVIRENVGRDGCSRISLENFCQADLRKYLDQRFPGLSVGSDIVEAVYESTAGNPLNVGRVLGELVDIGAIVQQGVEWNLVGDVEKVREVGRATFREATQNALDRLDEDDTEILHAASVCGESFDPEGIAAALAIDADDAEESLRKLVGVTNLVEASAAREWGAGPIFAFPHALYRDTVYALVPPKRRRLLHKNFALHLAGRGGRSASGEIALHFERAGDIARGIDYRCAAGNEALERFAYAEAETHLRQGIALIDTKRELAQPQVEIELWSKLGSALLNTKGFAAADVRECFDRALELTDAIEPGPAAFAALDGLHTFYTMREDLKTGVRLAEQMMQIAECSGDPSLRLEALHCWGCVQLRLGNFSVAIEALDEVMVVATEENAELGLRTCGHDPRSCSGCHLALAYWFRGQPERAVSVAREALEHARRIGHNYSIASAACMAAWVHSLRFEFEEARLLADECLSIATAEDFLYLIGVGQMQRGWARIGLGDRDGGLPDLELGMQICSAIAGEHGGVQTLLLAAAAYAIAGRYEAGLLAIDRAEKSLARNGDNFLASDIPWMRGELLWLRATGGDQCVVPTSEMQRQIESSLRVGVEEAERAGNRPGELFSLLSLGRVQLALTGRTEVAGRLRKLLEGFGEVRDFRPAGAVEAFLAEVAE